jgi:hypothetical protein
MELKVLILECSEYRIKIIYVDQNWHISVRHCVLWHDFGTKKHSDIEHIPIRSNTSANEPRITPAKQTRAVRFTNMAKWMDSQYVGWENHACYDMR